MDNVMKYYKDQNDMVYAYEADGSQDAYIPTNYIAITEQEAEELRVLNIPEFPTPPEPTKADLLAELAVLTAKIEALKG